MHWLKLKWLLWGSIVVVSAAAHDTTYTSSDTITPIGALWRSALLPGWGQLYYGSIPKAALFLGATATVAGIVVWNNTRFLDADRRYQQYDSTDGRKLPALREREFYRDQRDIAALWFVVIYGLNIMDAYVGGHMASFSLGDNTYLQLLPTGDRLRVTVRW